MTVKMIVQECQARDWKVELFYIGNGQMRITRDDGKSLDVFNATPPTTSFIAGHFSNNKYLNHLLYKANHLPVLETYVSNNKPELTSLAAEKFFASDKPVVVKPLNAAHGNGVTVDVTDIDSLTAAIDIAKTFSESVIIQEARSKSKDLRVTCINYKFTAALIRVPARVKGDGRGTIKELIEAENKSQARGENYAKPLNKINLEKAETYLGAAIDEVPAAGEYKTVLGTANVGTGGETIQVTDSVPRWLVELAEKCAKVSDLPVCGIDFLINDQPLPQSTVKQLKPVVIETNVCPSLFIHETPTYGQPQPVVKAYVDYLATL